MVGPQAQFVWGLDRVDELVFFQTYDATIDLGEGDPEFQRGYYTLDDDLGSVVAVIGKSGSSWDLIERIQYSPYGGFIASPLGDHNEDGIVAGSDFSLSLGATMGISPSYDVRQDLNRDGAVDVSDLSVAIGQSGESIDAGVLSSTINIVGYAGYLHDPATGLWLARHRWHDPSLGRWINRDPAGYIDGSNLYGYGLDLPNVFTDATGLSAGLWAEAGVRALGVVGKDRWTNTEIIYETIDCHGIKLRFAVGTKTSADAAQIGWDVVSFVPGGGLLRGFKALAGLKPLAALGKAAQVTAIARAAAIGRMFGLGLRSGDDFYRVFKTAAGPVEVGGKVIVRGRTLEITEFLVYPAVKGKSIQAGQGAVIQGLRELQRWAKRRGFNRLIIDGIRTTGANPGRVIRRSWDL